ncbi:MND1-interacting protein 1 [Camellia lanceoleosa]|uniref:MND1-interacting protein 1 n=1 Tax=Camellia lanceoleosa TaxID=1840588 RepID=A0ACC0G510_9ERIC|nr:MND1-interacting protein 1 [Camellia lanceoleosa]
MLHDLDKLEDSSDKDVGYNRECLICLKDEVSVVFLPCAHQGLCASCNDEYGKKGKATCPCCGYQLNKESRDLPFPIANLKERKRCFARFSNRRKRKKEKRRKERRERRKEEDEKRKTMAGGESEAGQARQRFRLSYCCDSGSRLMTPCPLSLSLALARLCDLGGLGKKLGDK